MHVTEKISRRQSAMLRAHTNITSRQCQRRGNEKEREISEKPHRNHTFFGLMPPDHLIEESATWRGCEDGRSCLVIWSNQNWWRNNWEDNKQRQRTFFLFLNPAHKQRRRRVTEQQGKRERGKTLRNVSGWLTLPGANQGLLFRSHEQCTGMRFGFPHRSSHFASSSSTFSFHKRRRLLLLFSTSMQFRDSMPFEGI